MYLYIVNGGYTPIRTGGKCKSSTDFLTIVAKPRYIEQWPRLVSEWGCYLPNNNRLCQDQYPPAQKKSFVFLADWSLSDLSTDSLINYYPFRKMTIAKTPFPTIYARCRHGLMNNLNSLSKLSTSKYCSTVQPMLGGACLCPRKGGNIFLVLRMLLPYVRTFLLLGHVKSRL